MAGLARESTFLPMIKCSQCGHDVAISMMGEHICGGAPEDESLHPESPPQPPPPPAPSLLGGAWASLNKTVFGLGTAAATPNTDTSPADETPAKQGQLTPVSASTGSRALSPKTPTEHRDGDEYFAPAIADTNSPSRNERPGGYGGFGEPQADESEPSYGGYGPSLNKQASTAPSLMQRMNPPMSPLPFGMKRKPGAKNAFGRRDDGVNTVESTLDDMFRNSHIDDGPRTSHSPNDSNGMAHPQLPRQNTYGGFPPPRRETGDFQPEPFGSQRAGTFPRQRPNDHIDAPARTPSAPGPRPDRPPPPGPRNDYTDRLSTGNVSQRSSTRSSMGIKDTSRAPPPRRSLVRPTTRDGSLSVNLADEFGANNPYHSPSVSSVSQTSSRSAFSHSSKPSSTTSPARSIGSRRMPSNASNPDIIRDDRQSSIDSTNSKQFLKPSYQPNQADSLMPLESPILPRFPASVKMDRVVRPDERPGERPIQNTPQSVTKLPEPPTSRRAPGFQEEQTHAHKRSQSIGRPRGNCKACCRPITGKSISSADGRLTGRYHKACFVCTTCREPFSSSTFYVLDDKPYCERHYHELNGSLCGTCGIGIEGEYLEDETRQKYHVGCFRCGDCGQVLREGYFEVMGRAYCERDAYRRVQPPPPSPRMSGRGPRPPMMGRGGRGLPNGPNGHRLGPPPAMARMQKRMTRMGQM